MQLALSSSTALAITRSLRASRNPQALTRRTDLKAPATNDTRWSHRQLEAELACLGAAAAFSPKRPLSVLVPSKEERLRIKGVTNIICQRGLPASALVDLGGGLSMSGPELLFVEMGRTMDPVVHLLLGMELTGRFVRDPLDPRGGEVTYNVEPVTTVERLRAFALEAHAVRGAAHALATIDRIVENAWSPMEAVIAALITLPSKELGYDLWPIALNPRTSASERMARLTERSSRVPDIIFKGTKVGLNYDGEDHFGLERIAEAAVAAEREPGNVQLQREAAEAVDEARTRIVEDKRRDRDLAAMGLTVLPVTFEDLVERGGLDRVMSLAIEAIERDGNRKPRQSARMLVHPTLAQARQELIWSLMPGKRAREARRRLEELKEHAHLEDADVIDYEIEL